MASYLNQNPTIILAAGEEGRGRWDANIDTVATITFGTLALAFNIYGVLRDIANRHRRANL